MHLTRGMGPPGERLPYPPPQRERIGPQPRGPAHTHPPLGPGFGSLAGWLAPVAPWNLVPLPVPLVVPLAGQKPSYSVKVISLAKQG